MGEKGLVSQLLSPKFGGYLTYGALETGSIAPGQPTLKNLLDLYNFRLITPDTKVYGIIGKPVGHSKSPLIFNAAFKSVGLNAVYVHFLVDDVEMFFNTYSSPDFAGCRYDSHWQGLTVVCFISQLALKSNRSKIQLNKVQLYNTPQGGCP